MTSTSSRESLSKARHMATSSQESNGPCSMPVASSTMVKRGGKTGIPLCSPEEWYEREAQRSHLEAPCASAAQSTQSDSARLFA